MSFLMSIFLTPLLVTVSFVLPADSTAERFAYDTGQPVIGIWQGTLSMPNAKPRFVQIVIERTSTGSFSAEFPQFSRRSPLTTCNNVSASERSVSFRCVIGNQPAEFRGDVGSDGQEFVGQVLIESEGDDEAGRGRFALRRSL